MNKSKYIISIDQGTSSCRAILFDPHGKVVSIGQKEFKQIFPKPGWVEHDPTEILQTQIQCVKDCVQRASADSKDIACIGITNQRETAVVWNRHTGVPVYNAIVWQCRRTQDIAKQLKNESDLFRQQTGLIPDAYFSGPKIAWILDNVPGARVAAESGDLVFGTIDSWLIWNLTKEKNHVTEPSNASRTLLFNIRELTFNNDLLARLNIPAAMMPKVISSDSNFGTTRADLLGFEAPITGVLGDQQAALFGQACFKSGMAKCTYGTGSFLLANIGDKPVLAPGLITTIAWSTQMQTVYALEGASFISGAIIQWLRDGLGIIQDAEQTESIATSLESNEGVYIVPALVGLGSPWWESDVRGIISGITRGTTSKHLVRAAVESMAYQVADIVEVMKQSNISIKELLVDGGATRNEFLLQFQSDLINAPIIRSAHQEATAWGVAALAGYSTGLIPSLEEVAAMQIREKTFNPIKNRTADYAGWKQTLRAAFEVK
jgi:glycerol kinase